jgi:hypothetical protein
MLCIDRFRVLFRLPTELSGTEHVELVLESAQGTLVCASLTVVSSYLHSERSAIAAEPIVTFQVAAFVLARP